MAEKFAREVLAPRVVLQNRRGTFDRSIITEMGRAGLLGCTLHGYGCAGVGHVAYGLVARCVRSALSLPLFCLFGGLEQRVEGVHEEQSAVCFAWFRPT